MADNDQSKLRYDDFVSNVQPDPAKPEATIMLSGFVGRGPEGHARIYPDPTLGTWYDVPEGDIIHSMPIADSKLGGSYVWVRAAAKIKPGGAAPAATEAVQPQQAAAAGINPTPATHCFICPPHTQVLYCPTQPVVCNIQPTPTVQTHCFICPPHTQVLHCPTHPIACNLQLTPTGPWTACGTCPPDTALCPQGAQQRAAMAAPGDGVPTFMAACFGPTFALTMGTACPTVGTCPTATVCLNFNGVFTPFGR
jgi:hypothetical protein